MAAAKVTSPYDMYAFSEQLDASSNTTSWVTCQNWRNHTLAYRISASVTACTVKAEGSLDGTYFFGVDPSGNGKPELSGNIAVLNGETNYAFTIQNRALNYIRLKLVSYTSTTFTDASVNHIVYRGN